MKTFLDEIIKIGASAGLKLLYAVIIVAVGLKLNKLIIKWLNKGHGYKKLDASVRTFIDSAVRIVLLILVFVTAAYVIGIPITSFLTLLASCGLAVGLALQGALSNLAGGLMILIFKPFKVGDFIDANGKTGTVTNITVFYTIIKTYDGKVVTIPNGTITASDITNYWELGISRLDIKCSTSYDDDIDRTREVLLALASEDERVLKNPPPKVMLDCMNSSSLDFIFAIWVNSKDYWDVKYDMNEKVKKTFDRNGISIPYPQLDVHTK